MNNKQRRAWAITAIAIGLTMSGCSPSSIETLNQEKDQEIQIKAEAPARVPPELEDAYLFYQRAGEAVVPEDLKAALQRPVPLKERSLRKFPYPYRAMLAFASDIDDTTPEEFAEYHRFLNTKEETPYGPGVGLDVGDSMWFYIANDNPNIADKSGHSFEGIMTWFDYTNTSKYRYKDLIKHYWQSGWIDSMHTFGDFSRKNHKDIAFKREYAVKAWEEMKANGIHCEVWINHGNEANVDSFGAYHPKHFSKYQEGDNPKSPYYHTDLSIKNGIRFVWNSIGESTFGHDSPIFEISLRDGQKVWGFHRYTHEPSQNGRDWTWVPREIHRQITKERLDNLVAKQQYAVVGQHFGGYNIGFPFDEKGIQALRMLESYQERGDILVARTSRLLNYAVAQKYVQYAIAEKDGETWVNITGIQDPLFGPQPPELDKVRGVTIYVKNPAKTHLLLNMKPLSADEYQINPPDETGKPSVGVKWFPRDLTDYTKTAP
jgi:hypothetical protein